MALNPVFNIQWHITNRCELRCRHCYLRGRSNSLPTELDINQCRKVVDSFVRASDMLAAKPTVDLTGGDPLLYENFWELFAYLREKDVRVSILGNPNKLNHQTARKLKNWGLWDYQISIDGLEVQHDWLRNKGSFARNMEAYALLKQYGIPTGMMFTLTKNNRDDLIPVMNLAAEMDHRSFAFDTVSPVSPTDENREIMLTPLELRETYNQYLAEARRLGQQGCKTVFTRKNHLYTLIMEEEGRLNMLESDKNTYFMGCPIGKGLIINSDGTVLSCPRIPISIGHVPDEEILDILLYSDLLAKFRDRANHHVCGNCSLFQYCRGCRASAWGVSGDFFGVDPYCWKHRQSQKVDSLPAMFDSEQAVKLTKKNNYEDAREIMSIYYGWDYQPRPKYDAQLQEILGRALCDKQFRQSFSDDPAKACQDCGYRVSDTILFELGRIEFDSFFDILANDRTNN